MNKQKILAETIEEAQASGYENLKEAIRNELKTEIVVSSKDLLVKILLLFLLHLECCLTH